MHHNAEAEELPDLFGLCPECLGADGVLDDGYGEAWAVCHGCRTRWWAERVLAGSIAWHDDGTGEVLDERPFYEASDGWYGAALYEEVEPYFRPPWYVRPEPPPEVHPEQLALFPDPLTARPDEMTPSWSLRAVSEPTAG